MTCEEARTSIHFHLDGDDHAHARSAREHASSCVHCGQHLLALQEVEQMLRTLPRLAAPGGLRGRILETARRLTQMQPASDRQLQ